MSIGDAIAIIAVLATGVILRMYGNLGGDGVIIVFASVVVVVLTIVERSKKGGDCDSK